MESKEIEQVFVARRPLKGAGPLKAGIGAHSALLLRTTDKEYFILEYLNDSAAHLYQIVLNVIESISNPPHEIFVLNGVKWTKQMHGKSLSGWTLGKAKDKMEKVMPDGYSFLHYEVCHEAQERLRQAMGIM